MLEWFSPPSSKHPTEMSIEDFTDTRRRLFLGLIMVITIPTLFFFGLNEYLYGNYGESLFDFCTSIAFTLNLLILRKVPDGRIIYRIASFITVILISFYAYTGGENGSALFWMFTLPLAVFFLQGRKEGLLWILPLYLLICILFFVPNLPLAYAYTVPTKIRFSVAFLWISIMSFGFEALHSTFYERLKKSNLHLQDTLNRLQTL